MTQIAILALALAMAKVDITSAVMSVFAGLSS
jgi:hypothetical protein